MRNSFIAIVASCSALFASASADPLNGGYAGAQVGYHNIDDPDIALSGNVDLDGVIYGAYAGFNSLVGNNLVVGLEGNFNLGTNALDSEYGATGHVGIPIGQSSMVFARSGYQWVNFDLEDITTEALGRPLSTAEASVIDSADDIEGGYLLGAGMQFGLTPNLSARAIIDTIKFDSVRVTSGIALHF